MKRFLKSKFFISVVLVIVAGVLTFVVLPKTYESQNATMDVVQFIEDVPLGAEITESMITVRTIGRYGLDNSGVITDKAQIIGKYAAQDIRRATNLYIDQFSDEWKDIAGAIDTMLEPGDVLIDVTVPNLAASVGGQITAGSYVNIITAIIDAEPAEDENGEEDYYSNYGDDEIIMEQTLLLSNVLVYKVQNAEGIDISELNRRYKALVETGEEDDFDDSRIPAVITLVVSQEQAIALANQEVRGHVHFTLIPETSQEYYAQLIEEARLAAEAEAAAKAAAEAEKDENGEDDGEEGDAGEETAKPNNNTAPENNVEDNNQNNNQGGWGW